MKRLAVFSMLTFWLWSVVPAGANTVPQIAISCDEVTFSWANFPERPVILTVTVTQGDEITVASFSTDGARDGEGSVPVQLHSGSVSAEMSWTLRKPHSVGPVTADLTCTPTTTEPVTTVPTLPDVPSTGSSSFQLIPPVSTTPAECGPDTLACTGPTATSVALFGIAWILLAFGVALVYGARVRREER